MWKLSDPLADRKRLKTVIDYWSNSGSSHPSFDMKREVWLLNGPYYNGWIDNAGHFHYDGWEPKVGERVRYTKAPKSPAINEIGKGSEGYVTAVSYNFNGLPQWQVSFPLASPIQSDPNAIDLGGKDILQGGAITQDHIDAINRGEATLPHPQEGSMAYTNWGFGPENLEPVDDYTPSFDLSDREPGEMTLPETWSSWRDRVSDLFKLTTWQDVSQKAQRYRNDGRIHVLRNTPQLVVGRVDSETSPGTTYDTEIERQDPSNPLKVSMWTCTCPWGEKWTWQRTRRWKNLEGRLCAHATGLLWQGMSLPFDDEGGDVGNQPQNPTGAPPIAPTPMQAPEAPPMGNLPQGAITPGTMPAGAPIPGAANPPLSTVPGATALPGAAQIAPNQTPPPGQAPAVGMQGPVQGGPGVQSQPQKPGEGGTIGFPGALSSWKIAMAERSGDPDLDQLIEEFMKQPYGNAWHSDYPGEDEGWSEEEFQQEGYLPGTVKDNLPNTSDGMCHVWAYRFAEFLNEHGYEAESSEDNQGFTSPEEFGYDDRSIAGSPRHCVTTVQMSSGKYMIDWTASQYGYNEFPMVQKVSPGGGWDREWTSSIWKSSRFINGDIVRANQQMEGEDRDGNTLPVNRNAVGEVLSSDEITTVVIFPIHENGALEPHLVKVEDFTANFSITKGLSPFIRRRRT